MSDEMDCPVAGGIPCGSEDCQRYGCEDERSGNDHWTYREEWDHEEAEAFGISPGTTKAAP